MASYSSSNKRSQKGARQKFVPKISNLAKETSKKNRKYPSRIFKETTDEYTSPQDGVYDDYQDSPEEIEERRPKKSQQRKNVVTFLTKENK